MSRIVTDDLLCKYIVDSGTLTAQELEVVRSYLSSHPDELEMVTNISASLYECDVEGNTDTLNHACAIIPFSDQEMNSRRESGRQRALELLDEIMVERTEQELIAHFDNQSAHDENGAQLPPEQQDRASAPQVATMK